MYIMINGNNGQPLSGLDQSFKDFVTGSHLSVAGVPIPNYVFYAIVVVIFMWFMWNKTTSVSYTHLWNASQGFGISESI